MLGICLILLLLGNCLLHLLLIIKHLLLVINTYSSSAFRLSSASSACYRYCGLIAMARTKQTTRRYLPQPQLLLEETKNPTEDTLDESGPWENARLDSWIRPTQGPKATRLLHHCSSVSRELIPKSPFQRLLIEIIDQINPTLCV